VCAHARACARVHAFRVGACVRLCACMCVRARVCTRVRLCEWVRLCERVRAGVHRLGGPFHWKGAPRCGTRTVKGEGRASLYLVEWPVGREHARVIASRIRDERAEQIEQR
jgi:hypothetical protein